MRKAIALFILILLSLVFENVRAEENIQIKKGDQIYYITKYFESDRFFVDTFRVDADGFQNRLSHFDFESEEAAFLKFENLSRFLENSPVFQVSKINTNPYSTFKLWEVTQEWNEDWEDRYTVWMKSNLTTNFLYDHKIKTDCADVPVTYRWIFAMMNGLPAGNLLAGSRKLFTQDSAPTDWLRLPTHVNWWENQRFLKALQYLHDNTYTASVFYDMYPVRIDSRAVSAGAVWVINGVHTYNIGQVNFNSANWMKMYSSTVPQEIRKLSVSSFDLTRPVYDESGFQRPRWIKKFDGRWVMVAAQEMPWYSVEQYSEDFAPEANLFAPTVYQRLSGKPADPEVWLQGLINNLDRMIYDRIYIVNQGFKACYPNLCPQGSDNYEVHSTPSRDRRLLETIHKIDYFISSNPGIDLESQWQFAQNNWFYRVDHSDQMGSFLLSLADVVKIWKNNRNSFDPNLSIEARWGVTNLSDLTYVDEADDFEFAAYLQMIPHDQP